MDCVAIWRSGTTYRDIGEKITSPPHIATVLKPTLKIAAKKRTNEPVHELVIN